MINRNSNVDRNVLKIWFQIAKKNNSIVALYKADNTLKNINTYQEGGLLDIMTYIFNYERFSSQKEYEERVTQQIKAFRDRFNNISLKNTLAMDYWGNRIKKKH